MGNRLIFFEAVLEIVCHYITYFLKSWFGDGISIVYFNVNLMKFLYSDVHIAVQGPIQFNFSCLIVLQILLWHIITAAYSRPPKKFGRVFFCGLGRSFEIVHVHWIIGRLVGAKSNVCTSRYRKQILLFKCLLQFGFVFFSFRVHFLSPSAS